MSHIGELLSLMVAVSWTMAALFADKATHRFGSMTVNAIRLAMTALCVGALLWFATGRPYPLHAGRDTWFWLGLSALVGFVFGDSCLFNCYMAIGSRYGQLFMTLGPPFAALGGWLLLGERLPWTAGLAMGVTLLGICISILGRGREGHKLSCMLPAKGIVLGVGAGLGQGVGLVLSKMGLHCYAQDIPAGDAVQAVRDMMPFAATFIRTSVGAAGFLLLLLLRGRLGGLRTALRDPVGMRLTVLTMVFGSLVGVSLSLMALQRAHAGIASTLMALVPVFILFPHAILYKERIHVKDLVGVCVSMAGVALFFLF